MSTIENARPRKEFSRERNVNMQRFGKLSPGDFEAICLILEVDWNDLHLVGQGSYILARALEHIERAGGAA